jgi:NADH-quinone oxidoreductase subunit N
MLFINAMGLSGSTGAEAKSATDPVRLYQALALIGALNAAVGGWYYLRVAAVMYLREPTQPLPRLRAWPALACTWLCAAATLALGTYPPPMWKALEATTPHRRAADPAKPGARAEAPRQP